jgi:hypothetical protein
MSGFLERIASHIYEQSRGDLQKQCVIFPSRRAGIYFLKYLTRLITKPVWAPSVLTINEFFESESSLNIAETEILMFELFRVYRRINKSAESFDEFYYWGEMLLNDFDDLDKYMADPVIIFSNVKDIKNIDLQFGDLDDEKAEIIKRFWINFEPEKPSPEKSEFIHIWSILKELYNEFKNALRSNSLAYEGMIFRDVAENSLKSGHLGEKYENIHFIGFNALNRCEKTIMRLLKDSGKARFYWDYDNSYIDGGTLNSAGLFMSENLKMFGNDMPDDWEYKTLLSSSTSGSQVEIIETTSDVAQVKLVPYLLDQICGITEENAFHTSIILADETLLVPLLTSFTANTGDINISMGYPLKMSGVYALIKYFLNLQKNAIIENNIVFFSSGDVEDILKHELIGNLLDNSEKGILDEISEKKLIRIPSGFLHRTENLRKIFRIDSEPAMLSDHLKDILLSVSAHRIPDNNEPGGSTVSRNLSNEFIYRILLAINRLDKIVNSSEVTFNTQTYLRILDKILGSQSVPFSGEPLAGIQIMGILETRALDFENIIILSVSEGILPTVTSGSSFIPFNIRQAFGLPTINHQESIFAYHFFRLLQRARKVTLVFNSNSEGLRTGEVSRFITQMKYEKILRPEYMNLSFDIRSAPSVGTVIERTQRHSDRLFTLYNQDGRGATLSPSAVNTWLNCRMKFYYRYVSGLKESEKTAGVADYAAFGLILHRLMKNIYINVIGNEVNFEFFDSYIKNETYLKKIINNAFHEEDYPAIETIPDGNEIIMKDILLFYLVRILKADRSVSPFTIKSLEQHFSFLVAIENTNSKVMLMAGGNVDRIDHHRNIYRIVDYKTGEVARSIKSTEDLFMEDRNKDFDGWLQTLIYCEAFLNSVPEAIVKPSIYRIRELSDKNFSDSLRIKADKNNDIRLEDYREIRSEFLDGLRRTIGIIFNPEEPFIMTEDQKKCSYCPFRVLCQR